MQRALTLYQTTIGKKAIMAVSGAVLFGFLVVHLVGNLQIFLGPEKLNGYAEFLHSTKSLLWGFRIVLLLAVVAHIGSAIALTSRNSDARPTPYHSRQDAATNYAARTMVWGGFIVLIYIVYHLMHLTFGFAPGYTHSATDVYGNMIHGFRNPLVTGFYVLAQIFVGMHLYHGAWSWFQSLGMSHPRWDELRRKFALVLSVLITVGNIAIPLSVLLGLVGSEVPQ